ncbi:MAG: hypothetical protein ACTSU5_17955 [Promethearchaeota archaeon]
MGDARAFPTLVERALFECGVAEVLADGACDTRGDSDPLQGLGIEPQIEPRPNASTPSLGCPSRSHIAWEIRKVGLERWLASAGHSRRQAVERPHSRSKLIFRFGGRVHGRTSESVATGVGHEVVYQCVGLDTFLLGMPLAINPRN